MQQLSFFPSSLHPPTLSTRSQPSPLSLYPLIPGSHRKYPTLARSGPDSQTQPGLQMGGTGHTSHSDCVQSEHLMPKRKKKLRNVRQYIVILTAMLILITTIWYTLVRCVTR